MLNLVRMFYALLCIIATMFVFIKTCYAVPVSPSSSVAAQNIISVNEVDLKCCTDDTCPTTSTSEGIYGVKQIARFRGIKLLQGEVNLPDELQIDTGDPMLHNVVMHDSDPGHADWRQKVRAMLPRDQGLKLWKASRTDVDLWARCTNSTEWMSLSKIGSSIECGDANSAIGIEFRQDGPKCGDPEIETVVTITKIKAEEEPSLADLLAKKAQAESRIAERNRKIAENERKIAYHRQASAQAEENMNRAAAGAKAAAREAVFKPQNPATPDKKQLAKEKAERKAKEKELAKQEKAKKAAEKKAAKDKNKGKGKASATPTLFVSTTTTNTDIQPDMGGRGILFGSGAGIGISGK